jgi:hypothetical protein
VLCPNWGTAGIAGPHIGSGPTVPRERVVGDEVRTGPGSDYDTGIVRLQESIEASLCTAIQMTADTCWMVRLHAMVNNLVDRWGTLHGAEAAGKRWVARVFYVAERKV